jgi:hypothetical protein
MPEEDMANIATDDKNKRVVAGGFPSAMVRTSGPPAKVYEGQTRFPGYQLYKTADRGRFRCRYEKNILARANIRDTLKGNFQVIFLQITDVI